MRITIAVALFVLTSPGAVFAQSKYLQLLTDARQAAEGVVASVAANNYIDAWKEL